MVYDDLRNKNLSKQPKSQLKPNDSKTKVNFSEPSANRYFADRRVVCSFRCDEGLWNEAKPVLKRVYGSVCRGIEVYLTNFIEANEHGVYFSNTEKPLHIEKIVIERNLRPRRKLEIRDDPNDLACHYCGSSAVGNFRYLKTNRVYPLCDFHAKANLDSKGWELVNDE